MYSALKLCALHRFPRDHSRSRTRIPRSGSAANSVIRIASRRSIASASLVGCLQRRSHTPLGGGPEGGSELIEVYIRASHDEVVVLSECPDLTIPHTQQIELG